MPRKPTANDFTLELSFGAALPEDHLMLRYWTKIFGRIVRVNESGTRTDLFGKLRAYFIHGQMIQEDGESLLDWLEDLSADVAEFKPLFRWDKYHGAVPRDATLRALSSEWGLDPVDDFNLNFIIFDRLELARSIRGHGIGCYFLNELMQYLSSTFSFDFFAILPAPLQFTKDERSPTPWERRVGYSELSRSKTASKEKLCTLYEALGFKRVERTPLMVRSKYVDLEKEGEGYREGPAVVPGQSNKYSSR